MKIFNNIDHAKLAEELEENCLGKEFKPTSVFIEYLNKKIDTILTELKEKEIHEPLVKIGLDKIKLLSNSFPNINTTIYEIMCQNFNEKIKFIINSIRNSVLSNKFDESANDIRKLYEVLTLLHNHFDYNKYERKICSNARIFSSLFEYFCS